MITDEFLKRVVQAMLAEFPNHWHASKSREPDGCVLEILSSTEPIFEIRIREPEDK